MTMEEPISKSFTENVEKFEFQWLIQSFLKKNDKQPLTSNETDVTLGLVKVK